VLDASKKDATVEKGRETIQMLYRVGIKTWAYFIIGLPGETEATLRETIDFAKSLPLDIALFHVAVPYAGTDFYFRAISEGWLDTRDWTHFDMSDSVVVRYPDMSAEAVLAGTKRAFREFYLRPRQIVRLLRMMASGGDVAMLWDIGRGFLSWLLGKREDRVAARSGTGRAGGPAFDAAAASGALHASAVVEATHSDLDRTKPSHRRYEKLVSLRADKDK
jgi:radical SAM superfamily enzyme YgiQ (UPF0313 family)